MGNDGVLGGGRLDYNPDPFECFAVNRSNYRTRYRTHILYVGFRWLRGRSVRQRNANIKNRAFGESEYMGVIGARPAGIPVLGRHVVIAVGADTESDGCQSRDLG